MAERRPTMMDPPIESLLERVDSKYTLVSLAAKRGREVNSYFNQLGDGLGSIVPPQVTSILRSCRSAKSCTPKASTSPAASFRRSSSCRRFQRPSWPAQTILKDPSG